MVVGYVVYARKYTRPLPSMQFITKYLPLRNDDDETEWRRKETKVISKVILFSICTEQFPISLSLSLSLSLLKVYES